MLIDIIAGARPNFMKIASVIRALDAHAMAGGRLKYRVIHTGQHYDERMSGQFFSQLGLSPPDVNLEVGSGTQAEQSAAIMIRYEKLLLDAPSRLCLVFGDVTSTMACAIAAKKLCIPVAHVEAGIRSGDMTMPEEINRIVTDSITDWFFTTSEIANENLRASGITDERIFFVGNTMIDTLLVNMERLKKPDFFEFSSLKMREYFVVTLHRPANVDNSQKLAQLLKAIAKAVRGMSVVFPVHPRTAHILKRVDDLPENFYLVDPQPYLEFIWLIKNARAVITDSGGITEETTVMSVPCLTLRDNTERPETVTIGSNVLVGTDPGALKPELDRLFAGTWKTSGIPEKWDGKTGPRIVAVLEEKLLLLD